jgi:small subunit ribosomal protein S17
MENQQNRMKKIGTVVSDKMEKTIVVLVERKVQHPVYQRTMKKSNKFMAHDEQQQAKIGDRVEIVEFRPLSRRKRWNLVRIVESKA